MLRRMIAAHGRRVADADPEDLAALLALRDALDDAVAAAVLGQRARHGRSWADIARATGTTRQAAQMRWGRTERPAAPPQAGPDLLDDVEGWSPTLGRPVCLFCRHATGHTADCSRPVRTRPGRGRRPSAG